MKKEINGGILICCKDESCLKNKKKVYDGWFWTKEKNMYRGDFVEEEEKKV